MPKHKQVAQRGGRVAGNARRETEKELGKSVISRSNLTSFLLSIGKCYKVTILVLKLCVDSYSPLASMEYGSNFIRRLYYQLLKLQYQDHVQNK